MRSSQCTSGGPQELDEEPDPSKILGLVWDKREDTLEIQLMMNENSSVTKRSILSQLSAIYDPLGVISPTIVEGKRIYREGCDEKTCWNSEVSSTTRRDWLIKSGAISSGTLKYLEA